ncbi:MAG: dihydrofolate reductase [Chitinophagaceae bacterium]|nr:MAG: dihydrofolate reductase [Chitinophagaceae bacterium]
MLISAITAVSQNNVIGLNNDLPWHLPADMKFFKRTTVGHTVVMGRKTYEAFGKAYPDRTNIVITRQMDYTLPDAAVVHSLEEAVSKAKVSEQEEIFILGGAQIFKQSMPIIGRIYLTRIYENFDGDAFFPEISQNEWRLVKDEQHEPDEKNKYKYAFQTWERV